MLEVHSLAYSVARKGKEPLQVLEQASFIIPGGHLLALIGPTASGKTTLLRILAGMDMASAGSVTLKGRDLLKKPLLPNELGWVPAQDDSLLDSLTVRENLMSALMLRGADLTKEQIVSKVSHVLVVVGLENIASERVGTLALPQRRRLKLGLALVADPVIVLCDDFTAGLDVRSEREMEALLKLAAGDRPGRIIIHATDSLSNLAAYDTVVVLHEGHVAYHGPAKALPHYFTVPTYDEVYTRLSKRPAQRWGDSWMRHRDSYYAAFKLGGTGEELAAADEEEGDTEQTIIVKQKATEEAAQSEQKAAETEMAVLPLPGLFAQARHLLLRRWTLLKRTRREWLVHLALLVGAPVLLWLLSQPSLGSLKTAEGSSNPADLLPAAHTVAALYFVQILLILFMALRLSAREFAARRAVIEREQAGGVRSGAVLLSALMFVLPVVLLQSFWMGIFIDMVSGGLPGNGGLRLLLPALSGVAFASICLGISANCRDAERAHSLSLTLLCANVLLAGGILGLPKLLGHLVHPFITAHYGWSGIMDSLHDDRLFPHLTALVKTWFATPQSAILMLGVHFIIGMVIAICGLRRRWR